MSADQRHGDGEREGQQTQVQTEAPIEVVQTDLHTMQVVRHLLWHKAMADFDDDGSRINEFIGLVQHADDGEHVSIRDPFHRDLAIAMELVIKEHLDPWDLDLSKFAELYLKEAPQRGVDLVTAGRILLMAWTVLKLQSDHVAERASRVEEPEEFGWDDVPDWDFSDEEWDYTTRIQQAPVAPIEERIRHKGDRKVTLMELIGAFEEVHEEAQQRAQDNERRVKARMSLKRRMRGRVGNMVHKEDLEAEIAETWQRILEHPTHPIPFSQLHEGDKMDRVQTFNALLFLTRDQKITVTQEEFPTGEVWVTPRLPEAAVAAGIDEEEVEGA
ncbi:MAG: segregation/condensation protein A [Thermoplasmatota archaeon]